MRCGKQGRVGPKLPPPIQVPLLDLDNIRLTDETLASVERFWTFTGQRSAAEVCAFIDWLETATANGWTMNDPDVRAGSALLAHPLSEHFVARNPCKDRRGVSRQELAILASVRAWPWPLTAGAFLERIQFLSTQAGGASSLRVAGVGTSRDNAGVRLQFAPVMQCIAQIQKLHQVAGGLVQANGSSQLIAALLVYAGIANAHPLPDGNGRAARLMANAVLQQPDGPVRFLPLYEIGILSRGGLLLRLREGGYGKDLNPIFGILDGLRVLWGRRLQKARCDDERLHADALPSTSCEAGCKAGRHIQQTLQDQV